MHADSVDPRDPAHPEFQKELGFAPCRDEDCIREAVHPVHVVSQRKGGRLPRVCPRCLAKLQRIKDQDITCPCGWRRDRRSPKRRVDSKQQNRSRYVTVMRGARAIAVDGPFMKYLCPSDNRGGCSGRGVRPSGASCKVCKGRGTVTWTPVEMFRFLSASAAERRKAAAVITRINMGGFVIGPRAAA